MYIHIYILNLFLKLDFFRRRLAFRATPAQPPCSAWSTQPLVHAPAVQPRQWSLSQTCCPWTC